ncbi:MAG: hypothetical protein JRD02_06355, partial [Deltaproteobacteria bacterium]|nr:hypothetical protein [Deltaproteobacteria bacterium]
MIRKAAFIDELHRVPPGGMPAFLGRRGLRPIGPTPRRVADPTFCVRDQDFNKLGKNRLKAGQYV